MKAIPCAFHTELHPETAEELANLRRRYPHLWPFQFVCIAELRPVALPSYKDRHADTTGEPR